MADSRRSDNFANKQSHPKRKKDVPNRKRVITKAADLIDIWNDTEAHSHNKLWDVAALKYNWKEIKIQDGEGEHVPEIFF